MADITQDTRVPKVTFGHDYGQRYLTVLDHDGLSTLKICGDWGDIVVRALLAAHQVYKNEEELADKLYAALNAAVYPSATPLPTDLEPQHRDVIDQALAAYQESRRAS